MNIKSKSRSASIFICSLIAISSFNVTYGGSTLSKFLSALRAIVPQGTVHSSHVVINGNSNVVVCNGRRVFGDNHIRLNGKVLTKECDVHSLFKQIFFTGIPNAKVEQIDGSACSIKITGDSAIVDKIITSFKAEQLTIGLDSCSYSGDAQLSVTIRVPELTKVSLNGASSAAIAGKFKEITIETNGASKATMQGSAQEAILKANGASEIQASGRFAAGAATVGCNGASNIVVCALQTLKMSADGASNITYSGDARVLKQNSNGASRINKR